MLGSIKEMGLKLFMVDNTIFFQEGLNTVVRASTMGGNINIHKGGN